jgi:hypothetical protein
MDPYKQEQCMMIAMADKRKPLTLQEFARMGGKARAKGLPAKRRKEIAAKAAAARWGKKAK